MKILFILMVLLFSAAIIRYNGMRRFILYLTAILLLPYSIAVLNSPRITANEVLALAFFISVAIRPKQAAEALRRCPWYVWAALVLVYLGHLGTAVMDYRLPLASAMVKAHTHFFDSFMLLAVGYFSLYENLTLYHLRRFLVWASIIVAGYGILTCVVGIDPYTQLVERSFNVISDFTPLRGAGRTRACSFLFNSHGFGFFCAAAFLTLLLLYRRNILRRPLPLAALALLLMGTALSGSRSSLLALLLCAAFICMVTFTGMQRIKALVATVMLIAAVLLTPFLRERVEPLMDAFRTGEVQTAGSNLELRKNQLDIALIFHRKSPTWGNGYDYYAEVLVPDKKLIGDEGLAGAESYLFMLLIEDGTVQIVFISLLLLCLALFFLSRLRQNPIYATWGLSVLALMVFVALASGMSINWKYSLPLIGMALKAVVNSDRKKTAVTA